MSALRRLGRVVRSIHATLLLGEEGDFTSWAILAVLTGAYIGFSLSLVKVFGSTVVLEYTRFAHDNKAHLYIPRTIVDNGPNSKLANLGTVWLPLYHLTIMPFTLINQLYVTGLAGSLINAVLVATTSSIIYLIVRGRLGIIASLTYGFSMYSLIHASSSYMVPIGQFLAVASTYYLLRYVGNSSLKDLTKASALALLATLARYETWLTTAALIAVVALKEFRERRYWVVPAYVPPAIIGVIGWLAYNWVIFGNPLEFITHSSSGASGYYYLVISKLLNPLSIDLKSITYVITWLAGPASLTLIPVGVASLLTDSKFRFKGLLKLIALTTPLILLLAACRKLLILDLPLYFYFLAPYLVILNFLGVRFLINFFSRYLRREGIVAAVLITLVVISFVAQEVMEYSLLGRELVVGGRRYLSNLNEWLGVITLWRSLGGGYVLASSMFCSYNLSVLTGLSPRYIIDEYDINQLRKYSISPWSYGVSVVLIPSNLTYESLKHYLRALVGSNDYVLLYYESKSWRKEFLKYYELREVLPISGILVFTRK